MLDVLGVAVVAVDDVVGDVVGDVVDDVVAPATAEPPRARAATAAIPVPSFLMEWNIVRSFPLSRRVPGLL
ncbi:MAG TPA: hypothetical protein VG371_12990 [Solirubrobacteraceae bacterium]|nr:hypothetical protein [Solirubrobacteraceae bacterium]